MLRKMFYLVFTFIVLGLIGPVAAQDVDMVIGVGTPVIDGEADDIWADAAEASFVPLEDPADGSGIWKALYDAENLYVLVDVTDDSLQNDTASSWQDDSVEIYFDGGNTKLSTALSGDDHQYTFGWTTEEIQGTNIDGYTDGIEHAQVDTETGWRIEVKMPWMSIWGVVPQAGDLIGIDCYYNDDDDGGDSREGKMLGFSAIEGWNDASQWGTAVLAAGPKPKPKIIWVSDNLQYDFAAGVPSDHGFVELLRAQGYDVDYKGEFDPHVEGNDEVPVNPDWLYWRELDDDKIAELEAADLIIIGRVNSSGAFDDANEAEMWNAISTPIISQSAHISRQYSKWGWFATGSTTNKTPRLMQVTAPDHDIFAGVEIDPAGNIDLVVQDAQVTLVKLNEGVVEGNGTLLGVHDEGYPWIVEWDAGVEYYEGSGQIAGGPRMFLGSAVGSTNEAAGLIEGGYNLTADGETVFLNAVEYMLPAVPVAPVHSYTFEDGTANDGVGEAHGTLIGGAEISDGALVNAAQDGWMEMPGDVIAMNTFDEVSIEAWYTPEEGANEGFTMLASFGLTNPDADWMGVDYFMMTSARGDDVSRAAISIGNYSDPWATESFVNGPEYDDGILHHMVATLTADAIVFYIDGVLMGSAALAGDNHIEGISQDSAYLAKAPYGQDPEWIGSIEEFNIYNVALSAKQVAAKYAAGFAKPEVENLVQNPSFEEDEAILDDPDWLQWCTWNPAEGAGSNAAIVDTDAADGVKSLRIDPVGPENWHFIVLSLPIPTEIGAGYTTSFWAKAAEPRSFGVQYKATDNSVQWGYADFELTTEWAEYTLTAEAQNGETKLEFFCAGSEVALWLDSVVMYKSADAPEPDEPTDGQVENLALNPSFEEDEDILDDPTWTAWCTWNPAEGAGSNAYIVDTEFVDGARSLRIEPVGTENGHFIVANISFPLEFGADYTFAFWAKAEATRPLTASFKAADNSVSWGFTDFELTTEWAEYSLTATSESDAGKLEFLCGAAEIPFWIDAVSALKAE